MKRILPFTIAVTGLIFSHVAYGATADDLLVTWRAGAYAPPSFEGKIVPPQNGEVTSSVTLMITGKPVDLSKYVIRWFANRELVREGKGLTRITFKIPTSASDAVELKATILGYQKSPLEKSVTVPVGRPIVILKKPAPDGSVIKGALTLEALPYFFSVLRRSDLSFSWSANGVAPPTGAETPERLTLDSTNGKSGDTIRVTIGVSNTKTPLEASGDSLTLTLK